ncbi:MAG: hypothetical protein M1835_005468 [Candelina submexicana]|nr:MAG: hypothetical protein M1835_005468 [Candelina submexicana]
MAEGTSKASSLRQRTRDSNSTSESSGNAPPNNETLPDLEKAEISQSVTRTTTSGQRVTRLRSIVGGSSAHRFSHPLSHTRTNEDAIVEFDGPDDPYRPLNWPFRKKVVTTLLYGLTTMGSTWASSVYSPGISPIAKEFHVGEEVSLLGLSLLLLGFGLGPLLWAPLSEVYGRKPAVLAPYFLAAIFSFGTATAKDIQTVMLTRFFAGFFGSAPVTNTGGVLSDIWSPTQRGTAIVGYAFAVVGGPTLGPIAGGAIVQSYLGWRWTEYETTGIMMMFFLTLDVLVLDESYPPVLLVYKARRLRIESGNWALHARHEEWDVSVKEMVEKFLIRPFQLLLTPICFLVAAYASFVYGILYLNLAAFPIAFQGKRGWNLVVGALPFLALLIGIVFGGALNIANSNFYNRRFIANNHRAIPEARLPPMMIGSIFFTGGLFIFAWTSDPSIPWIAQCIGAACMGLGFFTIFQGALNYLIDTFQKYSASAIAANTFLRSVLAASFPLFVNPSKMPPVDTRTIPLKCALIL